MLWLDSRIGRGPTDHLEGRGRRRRRRRRSVFLDLNAATEGRKKRKG